MMSLKRKFYQIRRLFRHRKFKFLVFAFIFLCVIFLLALFADSPEERGAEHFVHVIGGRLNFHTVDLHGELPGSEDPDTVIKYDLGNFEPPEEMDDGTPGDFGRPVKVDVNLPEVKHAFYEYQLNTHVADMISMNRSIPDTRLYECKHWHYREDLPTASVIIVFHNEGWSPLLRTVHSVLKRSESRYLKEVILVDDFSDKEHLKEKLDIYIKQEFNGIVKLIRNKEREGLSRSKTKGAIAATSEVVIFLDAHCEVNRNWLVPLLAPIRKNRKVMTVPIIDRVDMTTWKYHGGYGGADNHFRGILEWGLMYKETPIPREERHARRYNSQPYRSPTHAGGLFAIDKKWFAELGYYDPGLQIWGGENFELSFKIWMCGGGILFVPCSHVGHVYRAQSPYGFGKFGVANVIYTNAIRVVKTWMDEYGRNYFIREPQTQHYYPGDISYQLSRRKKLQCKSFDWYLKNVAYDVSRSYPLLPDNDVWGEARNPESGKCLDTMGRSVPDTVGASPCRSYDLNQIIRLNKEGQMTNYKSCINPFSITPHSNFLRTAECQKGTVNGAFKYNRKTQQIMNYLENTCVTAAEDSDSSEVKLQRCDDKNPYQKWIWKEHFFN